MNKLANTYLDAVDSLMAIHFSHPGQEDWPLIVANLADAVRELNQSGLSESPPHCFRHDWTPEELEQREKLLKPLTLEDLKRQVENAIAWQKEMPNIFLWGTPPPEGVLWLFGDFEIRRRK
jgi:hypothetical protein